MLDFLDHRTRNFLNPILSYLVLPYLVLAMAYFWYDIIIKIYQIHIAHCLFEFNLQGFRRPLAAKA